MQRSQEEVEMRCRSVLNRPDIILLVDKSSSPTSAYDMVKAAGHGDDAALAARWLGILRRDYADAYAELTNNVLRHAKEVGTAKEGTNEEAIRSGPVVPGT
jgi:hypothetical protein